MGFGFPTLVVKSKAYLLFLASAMLLFIACAATASVPVNDISAPHSNPILPQFEYYEDTMAILGFSDILTLEEKRWVDGEVGGGTFGFTRSQYWLRFDIANMEERTRNFIIQVDYSLLDDVSFFSIDQLGQQRQLDIGDTRPFYPRDVDHPSILYRLQLAKGDVERVYIRVKTKGSMIIPLRIWDENRFFENAAKEQSIQFFFYGAMTFVALINFAVFFTLRERLYLYYSMSVFSYTIFFFTFRGYGHQLLFPDAPNVNSRVFLVSMPLLAMFSILFARQFLKTSDHSPRFDMLMKGLITFEAANLFVCAFLGYDTAVRLSALGAILFFTVLFFAGPVTWSKKRRSGIFFTIAWIPLTLGVLATSGRSSGFLANNFWTEYAMQIGSALEALILTLALADRLYREREEKIVAQAESLRVEKQRNATQNQLTQAMTRDPVTQLPNRNRFEWMIRNTLQENDGGRYIIGVSRVTRIEEITRTLGLAGSERVLRKIARQMNYEASQLPGVVSTVNPQGEVEAVFQLAGDSFGVMIDQLVSTTNPEAYFDILRRLYLPIEIDSLTIELQPRYGAALYPAHGKDPTQLIRNAYVGMEFSEHAKDQIGFYNEALDIYNEGRLMLMSDLREALKNEETTLFYQPKMDVRRAQVVGIEALIRWTHPKQGFIPPDQFIPLAEETGVINDLTLWAFERAVKDLCRLRRFGYTGSISINISARDLVKKDLPDQLDDILSRYEVEADSIYLELTETASMVDPELGIAALTALTALGLKLSIDDFGSGYSSLSYLKRLPATEIKLDRSLIEDITSDESARTIVQTSINMVHDLGYELVAEGVENEATVSVLRDLGCDYIQGYWYCRPMPLGDLEEWMRNASALRAS